MTQSKDSGFDTAFKDKDGKAIKIHSYVQDSDGNRYFINSHCQAVPYENDAPAVELGRLIESSEVTVLSAKDMLNIKPETARRNRGRLRKKVETPSPAQEEKAASELAAAKAEAAAKAQAAAKAEENALHPVTMQMILGAIPAEELAAELRRRGFTLCAVRPALLEI